MSGVATITSTSIFFSRVASKSSPPTCLAPDALASSAAFPWAKTAIWTFFPRPWGGIKLPLTFWSDCLESIPVLIDTSKDSSNLTYFFSLIILTASDILYDFVKSIPSICFFLFLVKFIIQFPFPLTLLIRVLFLMLDQHHMH